MKRPGVSENYDKKYRGFHMVDSGFTALSFSRYSDETEEYSGSYVAESIRSQDQNTELEDARLPVQYMMSQLRVLNM